MPWLPHCPLPRLPWAQSSKTCLRPVCLPLHSCPRCQALMAPPSASAAHLSPGRGGGEHLLLFPGHAVSQQRSSVQPQRPPPLTPTSHTLPSKARADVIRGQADVPVCRACPRPGNLSLATPSLRVCPWPGQRCPGMRFLCPQSPILQPPAPLPSPPLSSSRSQKTGGEKLSFFHEFGLGPGS